MKSNSVQFAVVREDPEIEIQVAKSLNPSSPALLIGSGGCTALTFLKLLPRMPLTLLEPNPHQIELIRKKIEAISSGGNWDSLNSCGNFESLFKGLRLFLYEFVLEQEGWIEIFMSLKSEVNLKRVFQNKYWPVAFELFLSDSLLKAMFGPDAIQYAEPHSYPKYFQNLFERGLLREDRQENYFLHHVFLGHYLSQSLPEYLSGPFEIKSNAIKFENVLAQNLSSYFPYSLVSLSNIFDWMNPVDVKVLLGKLKSEMKSGAYLVYRQLNNSADLESLLSPEFEFDKTWSDDLHRRDRSLFYSSLHIGRKR